MDIAAHYASLPPDAKKALADLAIEQTKGLKFIPNPGPQTDAFFSKADIMLYGGSGGAGKSGLCLGLALTQHHRTLIIRRRYTDLGALAEEAVRFNGTRSGFSSMPRPKLRTVDGRLIEFGACQHPGDEESWQGQPHDLICFDEVTQLLESQVRFLMGWLRTTEPGQRCRVVMASNPPTSSEGDWVIKFFAPWLDPSHPRPAKAGELRWYITDADGKDVEVEGPEPLFEGGQRYIPKSRTFIPGRLQDNPFLRDSGYQATLDSLPEPLRSAIRDGNFMLSRDDNLRQIIPTNWVRAAVARWKASPPPNVPMCAIAVDPAQGGAHNTTIAMRHDGWYDRVICIPGKQTPLGTDVAALIIKHRRDNCDVVIDMGGGYGSSPYDHLRSNDISVHAYKGAEKAQAKTACGKLHLTNRRTEALWRFREALDPSQPGGSPICLPDDGELIADLTAPLFDYKSSGIVAESKADVTKRLGRSTDKGDAVMMAWLHGKKGLTVNNMWNEMEHGGGNRRATPKVNVGHESKRRR